MKSIVNTKKITKAMEMVSAAKMRRAVEAAVRTRAYAVLANELLERLSSTDALQVPLLDRRPVEKVLLIYVSSNRALCGSFNSNLFRRTAITLTQKEKLVLHGDAAVDTLTNAGAVEIEMIGIGKKSASFAKKQNLNLLALFDQLGDRPSFADVLPITRMVLDGYTNKTYGKIFVAFTNYRSSLAQEPMLRQLLPVSKQSIAEMLGELGKQETGPLGVEKAEFDAGQYVFEPDMIQILSSILPGLVEVQVYQAILESLASEHSARMVAMKSASDAAGDMLQELRLSFNKARQAAITQEISEIVGGAAALE